MGAADLFVLNTAYEGLSHVLIEAMQIGLPIITTRVGGNTELIDDGRSGLLVSFDDEEGLTRAIGDSLGDYGSALVRADEAKKSLSKFSKEKMIESVQNLFSD
jgi:glycosyltransferase involved in cell wall biosynthesis